MSNARNLANLLGTGSVVPTSKMPTGAVLQVKNTVKTDTFSTSSQTPVVVTGLTVDITPISTSSKILICADVHYSGDSQVDSVTLSLGRGGSVLTGFIADAASNRPRGAMHGFSGDGAGSGTNNEMYHSSVQCLDSPSTTSSTTYSVMMRAANGTTTQYVNRTMEDRDTANFDSRVVSTITVMEIAG